MRRGSSLAAQFPSARTLRKVVFGAALAGGGFALVAAPAGADHLDEEHNLADGGDVFDEPDNDDDLHITGGDGDDTITTGDGDNEIEGGAGDDTITTGDGDNQIEGGAGDDTITTGDGNSDIFGDSDGYVNNGGDDTITTGDGDNFIVGDGDAVNNGGDDTITTGDGDNVIIGDGYDVNNGGDDTITTGDGDNVIIGDGYYVNNGGDDTITTGDGNNVIIGDGYIVKYGGDDTITTGDGDNIVIGEGWFVKYLAGDDVIVVGDGNNVIIGDAIMMKYGEAGNDTIIVGSGTNLIVGDVLGDFDFLGQFFELPDDEESRGSFSLDAVIEAGGWEAYFGDDWDDVLQQFEEAGFALPGGDDVIFSGDGENIVLGGNGNDVICATENDVVVLGGGGSDIGCVVWSDTLTSTGGSAVSADLSTGMRGLDDELYEVDEDGNYNPFEFYLVGQTLVSSNGDIDVYKTSLGTIELHRYTGEMTFTPDAGASGSEEIEYGIRRKIIECADYSAFEFDFDVHQPGCDDDENNGPVLLMALDPALAFNEFIADGFIHSPTMFFTIVIPADDPEVPEEPGVVPVQADEEPVMAELPRTGSDTTQGLAALGLGLLALGGLASGAGRVTRRRREA